MTTTQIIAGVIGAFMVLYLLASLFEVATSSNRLNSFGWSLQAVIAAGMLAYATGVIG